MSKSKKSSSSKRARPKNTSSKSARPSKQIASDSRSTPSPAHVRHERLSDILADDLRWDRDSLESIHEEAMASLGFGHGKYPL